MKKQLLICAALTMACVASAETFTMTNRSGVEQEYELQRLIERQIGPGTVYTRIRIPEFPLNVNVVTVDLTNPYNRIETTVANEKSRGTESLVKAAQRQNSECHRPLAAANANFWIVSSQPEDAVYSGITRNVSLRNGKMITESNQHRDQWDGGTQRTGIVGISYDKTLYIDYCTSEIKAFNEKFGSLDVWQCNKGVWSDELCMYNSHYGATTQFMPIAQNPETGKYYLDNAGDATEVILDFAEGEEWRSGSPMKFIVKEVRTNAGKGTLGNHDLALVGRGDNATEIAKLAPDDEVTIEYGWTFNPGKDNESNAPIENAVGGNALVMRNGKLTKHNTNETYNSQIYSRTGYGTSADGKTLYIVVIDKSNAPIYGSSYGCSTTQMCEIARYLGCSNMANFDAGGSAELMVDYKIVNTTTEGTPRAVANGWMVYSTAPEDDNTVASLAFYDPSITVPVYATTIPAVIAYNKYGAVISYNYQDVEFSCPEELGSCDGNKFTAGSNPAEGVLTVSVGDIKAEVKVNVVGADIKLRSHDLLIDNYEEYPVETTATAGNETYTYDPATLAWEIEDPTIVDIDANGVLRGLKNGKTKIKCTIGEFSDEADVTVEIPEAPAMSISENFSEWKLKGASGITNVSIDSEGNVGFTYGAPRTPYIEFSFDEGPRSFYSLPKNFYTEFKSDVDIASLTFVIQGAMQARETSVKVEPETPYEAGITHRVEFDVTEAIDLKDLCEYPVKFKRLRYTIKSNSANKGDHTINFGGVFGEYPNYQGVESVAAENADGLILSGNPVDAGSQVAVSAPGATEVKVYSLTGALISETALTDGAGSFTAPASGSYVVAATGANVRCSAVLIVK